MDLCCRDIAVMRSDGGFNVKGRLADALRFKVFAKALYPKPSQPSQHSRYISKLNILLSNSEGCGEIKNTQVSHFPTELSSLYNKQDNSTLIGQCYATSHVVWISDLIASVTLYLYHHFLSLISEAAAIYAQNNQNWQKYVKLHSPPWLRCLSLRDLIINHK